MAGGTENCGYRLLTTRQRDVLERVAQFKSSKQIARELGISHHTVDQRIRLAIDKMGVASRADAARAFLEAIDPGSDTGKYIDDGRSDQPSGLDIFRHPVDDDPSPGEWNRASGRQDQQLREAQALYFAGAPQMPKTLSWASVLLKADRQNDLTAWGRTICIILTMLLTLLVAGALVGLAEGLSRLV